MIDVLPGLLITFFFLALTSACKPFCTEGLSRLHALTLIAQFISLFGGLVLIVEDYISAQLVAANENDNTSNTTSIIYALVYLCNGSVVGWPIIQLLLLKSPLEIVEIIRAKIKKLASGKFITCDNSDDSDSDSDANDKENVSGGGCGSGGSCCVDCREKQQDEVSAAPATLPTGGMATGWMGFQTQVGLVFLDCAHEGDHTLPVTTAPALDGSATVVWVVSTSSTQTDLQTGCFPEPVTAQLPSTPAPPLPLAALSLQLASPDGLGGAALASTNSTQTRMNLQAGGISDSTDMQQPDQVHLHATGGPIHHYHYCGMPPLYHWLIEEPLPL